MKDNLPKKPAAAESHFDFVAAVIALAVGIAVWSTWPVVELGADDDWSYAKTALDLAHTGHLHYNGWATIMLGVLAYWGAFVIRVCGFSFTALRLGMLPFVVGCAWMLVRICRRSVIPLPWTVLIALTVCLSPIFVFCSTNFSSDIPALLCILVCGDLAATVAATPDRRMWRKVWLLIAVAEIGFLGGTIRQIVWGMPIISVAYVGWQRRKEPPIMRTTIISLVCMGIGMLACMRWYAAQPYAVPEYLGMSVRVWMESFPRSLVPLITLLLTGAMLLMPVTAAALPALWPKGMWKLIVLLAVTIVPVLVLQLDALGPWMGNIVTAHGINHNLDAIGGNPEVLPMGVCLVVTLCTIGSLALYALRLLAASTGAMVHSGEEGWGEGDVERREPLASQNHPHADPLPEYRERGRRPTYAQHVRRILTLYAIGYVALILLRSATTGVFDRYLLPLLPVAGLWIAHAFGRVNVKRPAWVLLAIWAYFSIANTHDYFAAARAHLAAANGIESRGVPRTQITAGMAYDAWTQLQTAGYVNESRIVNPPGAFVPHPRMVWAGDTSFWYWEWTPAVTPRCFVVNQPQQDLVTLPLPPVRYTAWLPPFERQVWVQSKQ